jgi:SAM-dependent methyltransferase
MDERLDTHLEVAALRDEEYVRLIYRLALRREPEPEGRRRALERLSDATLSRATLLHELVTSEEFRRVRSFDDSVALSIRARAGRERPRALTAPAWDDGRMIEIPWVLARYGGEQRVLDAGYAFAEAPYLTALVRLGASELVGVDLAEREVPGLRSVVGDLRALPFRDGSFDLVLCVSTLEHVGADTSVYGYEGGPDDQGMARALLELRRVLTSHGRLLITVPLGERKDFGWWVQLELADWHELFAGAGFAVVEEEGYALGEEKWCAVALPAGDLLCAELRPRGRGERARRLLARAASPEPLADVSRPVRPTTPGAESAVARNGCRTSQSASSLSLPT